MKKQGFVQQLSALVIAGTLVLGGGVASAAKESVVVQDASGTVIIEFDPDPSNGNGVSQKDIYTMIAEKLLEWAMSPDPKGGGKGGTTTCTTTTVIAPDGTATQSTSCTRT